MKLIHIIVIILVVVGITSGITFVMTDFQSSLEEKQKEVEEEKQQQKQQLRPEAQEKAEIIEMSKTNPRIKGIINGELRFYIEPLPSYAASEVKESMRMIVNVLNIQRPLSQMLKCTEFTMKIVLIFIFHG